MSATFIFDAFSNLEHMLVGGCNDVCTLAQVLADLIGNVSDVFFVFELVVQTCPEIHSDGPDLDFHTEIFLFLGEEDRDLDDQMVTAVAVRLWIFDVIFYLDNSDIVLLGDQIRNGVDIIDKSAHNPDAGYIQ